MLPFVLLLTAGGLIAAACLIIFLCENVPAGLAAVFAARLALLTAGGWIGALCIGLFVFAIISVGLRLGMSLTRSWPLRLGIFALVVVPAATTGFLIANAVLALMVPSPGWRILIASLAAIAVAAGAARKLVAL